MTLLSDAPGVTPAPAPTTARFTLHASVESVVFAASLFWLVAANRPFLAAALQGREVGDPTAWGFAAGLTVMVVALHVLLLLPFATRWSVKPLVALLLLTTAFATYFMAQFGVYLDPSMLRNVLHTDVREARELFGWSLLPHLLLHAGLPLLVLWRVRIVRRPWKAPGCWQWSRPSARSWRCSSPSRR